MAKRVALMSLLVFLFAAPVGTAFAVGTPGAPEYVGGADGGGLTNSGSSNLANSIDGSRTIAVQGNYAFALSSASSTACSQTAGEGNGCELKVFDISDPSEPTYVGGGDASGSANSGTGAAHGYSIVISGNYAYTLWSPNSTSCSQTAGSAIGCEFKVWDISDPANPTYVGGGNESGETNSGGFGSLSGLSIAVSGNYAYTLWVGSSSDCASVGVRYCEFKIWDISDPSEPTLVGAADASGSTNAGTGSRNGRGIVVSGNYAYTVWDGDSTACSQTAGSAIGCELKVFDISDPANPTYVGGADASGSTNTGTISSTAWSVAFSGNYVYTVWQPSFVTCSQTPGSARGCELKVWDISNPAEPTYVGGADSSGSTNAGGSSSSSAFDVYTSDGYAYTIWANNSTACSGTAGSALGCELKVFDISTPSAPTYVGGGDVSGSTNSGTGSVSGYGIFVANSHVYTLWDGDTGTCSQTAGSAVGCELKVWNIGDSQAPSVSLTAPSDSTTLTASTSVSISASSSDNIGVAGVTFYVNGVQIGSEDTSSPFSVTWDSTATSSEAKTIIAVARDAANNYATSSSRTVTVANEPSITAIEATAGTSGATITWTTAAAASSRVFFGVVSALASSTSETDTATRVTSHSVALFGLPSCVTFKYSAVSTNVGDDTATSTQQTFRTTGCTGSASVASSTEDTITTASGGIITQDALSLTVPTSFTSTSSSVVFQAHKLDGTSFFALAGTPSGKNKVGNNAFTLVALIDATTTLSTFSNALTVVITYDASDVSSIDESSLKIYSYDGSNWSVLSSCTVDTGAHTVSCTTTHFSDFALFGDTLSSSSSSLEGGGGGALIGCPDFTASNYSPFALSVYSPFGPDFSLCEYGVASSTVSSTSATPATTEEMDEAVGDIFMFVRDLKRGMSGEDVRELQRFLNVSGFIVAKTGVGSPGNETNYFGPATQRALAAFQSAQDISPAVGYFGPITRARINVTEPDPSANNEATIAALRAQVSELLKLLKEVFGKQNAK